MKKILIALAIAGFTCSGAQAQVSKASCEAPKAMVCHKSGSCYKTKYAEDYKVCRNDYGYFICCETPNAYNSTFPRVRVVAMATYPANPMETREQPAANDVAINMTAPQSQSYPEYAANSATSYEGYYNGSGKHYIKVCYGGDNVAELNRNPYNGCPSPAYDGPDANRQRNINVSTPSANAPLGDITGRSE